MATWTNKKCGYCGHQDAGGVTKYACPECKRAGCPQCMPAGEAEPCRNCKAGKKPIGFPREAPTR